MFREPVDNRPVEIPTRLRLPQSRTDQIRSFIRQELSQVAQAQKFESFEDSEDFEIDEDAEPALTPYEMADLEPVAPPDLPPVDGVKAEGPAPVVPAPPPAGTPAAAPAAPANGT